MNNMVRIALFLLTNLAILVVFNTVLRLTGIQLASIHSLLITAIILGFSGSIISLLLSKKIALRSVGGEVIKQPQNETESWLVKTVRRQSQQVGINMPQVAIYNGKDINAFATGARRNASLIAVSTGMIESMSRDEAEAVLAHEISHISNGDMVTMVLIQGVVNTFVIFLSRLLAQIASGFFSEERNQVENNNQFINSMMYFAVSMVLEIVFAIIATMITMWFSRYREFRADASAANLVGSHKMIAALNRLKTSHNPQEESHIIAFCINGRNKSFSELFLSHPSLEKRIEALKILNI